MTSTTTPVAPYATTDATTDAVSPASTSPQASVNGVCLASADETLDAPGLRQRACTELLRQAAMDAGLLARDDPAPQAGVTSEAASAAIEALLERELPQPELSDEACRRYHSAHAARYAQGEQVLLRHVLFAVTPGVDVTQLRLRAEACLLDLRCADPVSAEAAPDADNSANANASGPRGRFAESASRLSNCPSGQHGGELGWLQVADCAPEFAREVFGQAEVGVLPRLVHSRFGLHVVEVLQRQPGTEPPFEVVRGAVAQALRQQSFATALGQYLRLLAGQAQLQGVDLDAADSPLLQ